MQYGVSHCLKEKKLKLGKIHTNYCLVYLDTKNNQTKYSINYLFIILLCVFFSCYTINLNGYTNIFYRHHKLCEILLNNNKGF